MHKANGFTRQELLTTIKMNGPMTADELGKELGISPVAVRQHLAALEAEGHIVISVERRALGRPVHRYMITARGDETFPRNYDSLANALLEELRFAAGDDAVDKLFAARRERMRASNLIRVQGKPLAARVAEVARIQTESGYMAEAQETEEGFVLVQHNCAICRVAQNHNAACDHELRLFKELFEGVAEVEREQHMLGGEHTCSYRIRPTD